MHRHGIVDAATGEDDLGSVAEFLRPVGEVIRIDADAMSADKTGMIFMKIPFRAGGCQHIVGMNPDPVENQRQLVHQGDV